MPLARHAHLPSEGQAPPTDPSPVVSHFTMRKYIWAVPITLVLLIVAGCKLKAETPRCVSTAVDNVADYTEAFASSSGVWSAGDAANAIRLDGNRVLWTFADSYLDNSHGFVRNSTVLQDGRCFTPLTVGTVGKRQAIFTSNDANSWLWPTGGFFDPSTNVAYVLSNKYVTNTAPGAYYPFSLSGSYISKVTITPQGMSADPVGTSPAPQGTSAFRWTSVTKSGDWVYIYGRHNGDHIVARSSLSQFTTSWTYWNGSSWSPNALSARDMFRGTEPVDSFHVAATTNGFIGTALDAEMTGTIAHGWSSPTPYGPWTDLGVVLRTPTTCATCHYYLAGIENLPGAGWTAYVSRSDTVAQFGQTALYRPVFTKVTIPAINSLIPKR